MNKDFTDDLLNQVYRKGYNKAIDDFTNKIINRIEEKNRGLYLIESIEIADKLKGRWR